MKSKLLFIALGAVALATASCSDDEFGSSSSRTADAILTATVEGQTPNTRVGFGKPADGVASFYWSNGDKVGVTLGGDSESAGFYMLTLAEGDGGKSSASFTGTLLGNLGAHAVYPYNTNHKWDSKNETLTYYFPSSYDYSGLDKEFYEETNTGNLQSFNAPMFAEISSKGEAEFKHLGGVFCVRIPSIPVESGKLVFTANKQITGGMTASAVSESDATLQVPTADASENNVVTINFEGATKDSAGVFYIPAPVAGDYKVNIKLTDAKGTVNYVNTEEKKINLARRTLYGIRVSEGNVFSDGIKEGNEIAQATGTSGVGVALQTVDKVIVTGDVTSGSLITVPSATTNKTMILNSIADNAKFYVLEVSNPESSTPNLTISLPATNDESTAPGITSIKMPNSTVTIEGNTGSTILSSVTVTSCKNLVVENGTTIKSLTVKVGNVLIKDGAKVEAVTNSTDSTLYIIYEGETAPTGLASTDNNIEVITPSEYEAKLNAAEVASLKAAVAAGSDYTLTRDITMNGHLVISNPVTLNLDGHTITLPDGYCVYITTKETATIDLGEGGRIEGNGGYIFYFAAATKAHLKGGTVKNNTSSSKNDIVYMVDDSSLEVTGTTLLADQGNGIVLMPSASTSASVTINKGTIINVSNGFAVAGNGSQGAATIVINGGEITSNNYALYLPQDGTTTINGGTITGGAGAVAIQQGTLNINGGDFISNGTFSPTVPTSGDGTAGLYDATLCVAGRYGNATVNITGGTFTAKGEATSVSATHNNEETSNTKNISVKNATFSDLTLLTAGNSDTYKVDGNIKLANNLTVDKFTIYGDKNLEVDLDGHTFEMTRTATDSLVLKDVDHMLKFKNGTILKSSNVNVIAFLVYKGHLAFDGIQYSAPKMQCGLTCQIETAKETIENSTVIARGYGAGTNASVSNGSLVYGQDATIVLKNSTFKATYGTGFMNNVPAHISIDKCTFFGCCQGAYLRGGTYEIANSTFELDAVFSGDDKDYGIDGNRLSGCCNNKEWQTGNAAAFAPVVIGNRKSGSYQYETNVTFTGTQESKISGSYPQVYPGIFIWGETGYPVTVKGDLTGFTANGYDYDAVIGGNVDVSGVTAWPSKVDDQREAASSSTTE